jgi:spore germination cell wall hydrolase CwlJ-like protein
MFVSLRAAALAVASLVCASPATAAPSLNMATIPAAAQQLATEQAPAPAETPVVTLPSAAAQIVTLTPAAPVLKARALVDLIDMNAERKANTAELECLAGAIYFESKGEPIEGQLAVAEVVLNRAKSGKFPTTICGVVKQRHQFSFVRGGRFPPIARASAAWRKAVAIAHIAIDDLADSRAQSAMFFHATYVRPGWRGAFKRVAQVGRHIFYR